MHGVVSEMPADDDRAKIKPLLLANQTETANQEADEEQTLLKWL